MNYIGIPFKDKGRDIKGCDCYGLVMLYYKNEFNIDIPDTNIIPNQTGSIMRNFLNEIEKHWIKIDKPEKGCVVAMAMHEDHPKLVTHFALALDEKTILHSVRERGSHKMSIDNMQIKSFIKGFYKWQN